MMKAVVVASFVVAFCHYGYAQTEAQVNSKKITMLGLRTVTYKVNDIDKAKKWYAQAFQTEPYFDQPFYVGFNIGGYELGLQPEEHATTDKNESVVAYWGVSKIEPAYDRLIQTGATEVEQPHNVGGNIMTATVKDPWGNTVGLIYNPEFRVEE